MNKRIIIAGATGFIGKRLTAKLSSNGYNLSIISRDLKKSKTIFPHFTHIDWNLPEEQFINEINDSLGIINLAGASLAGKKWTESYKKVIIDSRVRTTKRIVQAIEKCLIKPKFLINASAIGFYGNRGDEILTENSIKGSGFLSDVCLSWEEAAKPAKVYTRVVIPRIGIVLDKKEGALSKMILPYKLFIGGSLGSKKDWISWIHIDDLIDMFLWAIENENIKDQINCVSPTPIQKKDFNIILAKVLRKPNWLSLPEFALKFILGEASEMLISSQRVLPDKPLSFGFKYQYEELDYALFSLLRNKYLKFV